MERSLAQGLAQRPQRIVARYRQFLPEAQALSEREHSPAARLLLLTVTLVVATALLWAGLSQVEKVATAPGQVRPLASVMNVNHAEGGRVAEVLVGEGERVSSGQALAVLDAELLDEEIAKIRGRQAKLMADLARLQSEAEDQPIAFPAALKHDRPDLVEAQTKLYDARRLAQASERVAAERVIEQRRSDIAVLDHRIVQLSRSLEILEEQRGSTAVLMDKGYFPKLRYLSMQREISEISGQLDEAREGRESAVSALAEAKEQRSVLERNWNVEVFEALAATLDELEVNGKLLAQQQARRRNLVVRAPADGIVQNLAIANAGQAVAPNELLMTVVPEGEGVMIEARVRDRDIGSVVLGQRAAIKVRTYDFIRYGTLAGQVARIAADATNDPNSQESFFLVQVAVNEAQDQAAGPLLMPSPGMLVDVDFHIGERSILSYLTDRLLAGASTAFTER
ncbi:MAG: HlyD family type I secretion periplasmic adaptor subunit [Kiloniellales bacterium]|nr:HlyD family type I secretion periplasmic adaptor subunit [Kiloniellales bacterium]